MFTLMRKIEERRGGRSLRPSIARPPPWRSDSLVCLSCPSRLGSVLH